MLDISEAQQFEFTAPLWLWNGGKASWHFITIPKEESEQIKFFSAGPKRGWGSVRVEARIGNTSWRTSVFPSKEADAYILPVKAEVRKKESMVENGKYRLTLTLI